MAENLDQYISRYGKDYAKKVEKDHGIKTKQGNAKSPPKKKSTGASSN